MSGSRGRIVMLVQNGVEGDSRVQKEAASAAAAGWEVFLLGRSPDMKPRKWRVGEATVRLVPVERGFARRPHEVRPNWMRDPLAYASTQLTSSRERQLRAWRAEIGQRSARLRAEAAHSSALAARLRRAALLPRRAAVKLAASWIGLRAGRTTKVIERRRAMDSRLDRFTTRFWELAMGRRAWRHLDPSLWDLEFAFGPVVDRLAPDLIHANDFQMLGVGARAVMRRRAKGRRCRLVWDAHEYLPGMKPWTLHPRWRSAQVAHEREYAPVADAVVTVSERHAELLMRRHGLRERPTVVLNAPELEPEGEYGPVPDLRERCGIGPDVPLMVYSGAAAPQRGLDVMVESLPSLDGVHTAFVTAKPEHPYMRGLVDRAAELGVGDRLHLVPYVPHQQVVPYLAPADIGVIPIHHWLNHEIQLITKFFEYSHARLPLIVSDVETMARTVTATGQGEVFKADDSADFAQAVKSVLADPDSYRRAYDDPERMEHWTWEAQSAILCGVYSRLLDD